MASCSHVNLAGYSGMSVSDSNTKRSFCGSVKAGSLSSCLTAPTVSPRLSCPMAMSVQGKTNGGDRRHNLQSVACLACVRFLISVPKNTSSLLKPRNSSRLECTYKENSSCCSLALLP